MDSFEDLANLAEEFQVKTTVKFTGEPRKYRKRMLFQATWQELKNIDLDVEDKSEDFKSQQSQALPSSIQDKCSAEFTLFPKLPLEPKPSDCQLQTPCRRRLFPSLATVRSFNPDQDIIGFDSLKTMDILVVVCHRDELRLLLHDVLLPSNRVPWRVDGRFFYPPWVIHPSLVKRVQTTPRSLTLCNPMDKDFFERYAFPGKYTIFRGFIYQDLDEFIIQDFDCKFPHNFDSPEKRELWKGHILRMFKVESGHDEYAFMRAGSAFKVSKVIIRPGAKIARPCEDCSEIKKEDRRRYKQKRANKYYCKIFWGNRRYENYQPEEDSEDQAEEDSDDSDDK